MEIAFLFSESSEGASVCESPGPQWEGYMREQAWVLKVVMTREKLLQRLA